MLLLLSVSGWLCSLSVGGDWGAFGSGWGEGAIIIIILLTRDVRCDNVCAGVGVLLAWSGSVEETTVFHPCCSATSLEASVIRFVPF